MNREQDTAKKFWEEREREKGGKVEFFSFATFVGSSKDRQLNLGGLLYIINTKLYFEDFEKKNWLLNLTAKRTDYRKTEINFEKEDIAEIKKVSKREALKCIAGEKDGSFMKSTSAAASFFFSSLVQFRLREGYSLFFDIMKQKEFMRYVWKNIPSHSSA